MEYITHYYWLSLPRCGSCCRSLLWADHQGHGLLQRAPHHLCPQQPDQQSRMYCWAVLHIHRGECLIRMIALLILNGNRHCKKTILWCRGVAFLPAAVHSTLWPCLMGGPSTLVRETTPTSSLAWAWASLPAHYDILLRKSSWLQQRSKHVYNLYASFSGCCAFC